MHDAPLPRADKVFLRATLIAREKAGPASVALSGARAALLTRPLLRNCARVALYRSMPGEVETAPLARALWADGCALYLPVTCGRGKHAELKFVAWTPDTPLTRHRGGMLQPASGPKHAAVHGLRALELDAVVVPGLAFDLRGARLGRGWGCYDRALAGFGGLAVGLAHAWQLLASLPREAHDCGVDVVVTPVGAIPTASRRGALPRSTAPA